MTVLQSSTGKVTIKDVSLRLANVTTTERNALNSPTNGDMVYNTTTNALNVYINGVWTALQSGAELQGLENLVEDTSPQLGGDLDVGGNSIVSTSSGPINIAPDGTGKISLSGVTQLGGNIEGQTYDITTTGKILYSNVYSNLVDLPSASTYHGMFAHVHATGKAYFAHGGNWVELANMSDVPSGGGGGAYIGTNDLPAGNYFAWRPDAPNTSWYVFQNNNQNDRIANGGNFSTQLTFTVGAGGLTGVGTGDFGTSTRAIFKLG